MFVHIYQTSVRLSLHTKTVLLVLGPVPLCKVLMVCNEISRDITGTKLENFIT